MKLAFRIFAAAFVLLAFERADATLCAADQTPSATLLFPYAIVDLSDSSSGISTEVSIRNHNADPRMANFTFWTNRGVPVFSFPIYLAGFDTLTIDLRQLLLDGETPLTGPSFSVDTALSNDDVAFPNCSSAAPPSINALDSTTAEELRKALLGQATALLGGNCAAADIGFDVPTFYATVDVVTECGVTHPGDPDYYSGSVGFSNVLTGSYRVVDPLNNFSWGEPAVHIEAANLLFFQSSDATFYGNYAGDTSDRREPLPTSFSMSVPKTPDSTFVEALVWREPKSSSVGGFHCGTGGFNESLAFSGTLNDATGESSPFVALDRFGQITASGSTLPGFDRPEFAMSSAEIDTSTFFSNGEGRFLMNLQNDGDSPATFGQAWIITHRSADGIFDTAVSAVPIDDNCPAGGSTSVSRSGPLISARPPGPVFRDRMEEMQRWSIQR